MPTRALHMFRKLSYIFEFRKENLINCRTFSESDHKFQSRETICIIDLAFKALPLPSILEMIKAAGDICHQSCQNCLLIRLPTKTKAMTMTAHLNLTRKIEDALIQNSLNPEYHMTAVFDIASLHGSDSREGVARFRLCLSENYDTSPWLTQLVSNLALLNRRFSNTDRCCLGLKF